ncbi:hypothetical protein B0A58_01845 [Flavobacterium branchiophilum NBRC 15030 = ATCC 35035]|uniref:Uncharacterized protein n=1 Tax=Flavobacterium branchiophilum TaxID=55197 RepID=A0A543G2S0_9FLAO|nr:hypothetical protein [Flavobacterium branchiophilum]OXA80838.1 hypothetical protein B0A58_01845 [Flavobacterium branchiophilum NBRC 15030 = ATCC 35035]TQM40368.1 hypothetical protein BC670_1251 [Flavobacterium branchiophilum]
MITTIFKKSNPINYILIGLLIIGFYIIYIFNQKIVFFDSFFWIEKTLSLLAILGSLITAEYITQKNGLSKGGTYSICFGLMYFIFFPSVFNETRMLCANFLVLLAIRRLILMQTLKFPKEKIFDASFWIFIATIFHFWSIWFLLLVYVAIVFHASRDYRHWLIPFIALFCVLILFALGSLIISKNLFYAFIQSTHFTFDINYFASINDNISFSIYLTTLLFFAVSLLLSLSKRPLVLGATYKIVLFWLAIGLFIFAVSAPKNNSLLVFTFVPLSIICTAFLEFVPLQWQKDTAFVGVLVLSIVSYCIHI